MPTQCAAVQTADAAGCFLAPGLNRGTESPSGAYDLAPGTCCYHHPQTGQNWNSMVGLQPFRRPFALPVSSSRPPLPAHYRCGFGHETPLAYACPRSSAHGCPSEFLPLPEVVASRVTSRVPAFRPAFVALALAEALARRVDSNGISQENFQLELPSRAAPIF